MACEKEEGRVGKRSDGVMMVGGQPDSTQVPPREGRVEGNGSSAHRSASQAAVGGAVSIEGEEERKKAQRKRHCGMIGPSASPH